MSDTSDWLKVMLEEIARKQSEREAAEREFRRREGDGGEAADPGADGKGRPRGDSSAAP